MQKNNLTTAILVLFHVILLAGCGGDSDDVGSNSNQNSLQTTVIGYEISGLERAPDGSYKGRTGTTVVVKAKAYGPKAKEVTWTKLRTNIQLGQITNPALINSSVMTIDQAWECAFDNPVVVELTFGPDKNITINGIPAFIGEKTFKIVIE